MGEGAYDCCRLRLLFLTGVTMQYREGTWEYCGQRLVGFTKVNRGKRSGKLLRHMLVACITCGQKWG